MSSSTLFVIIDPTHRKQPALERAADSARRHGSHLHVFCCDYVPKKELGRFRSRHDAKHRTLEKARSLVDQLVQPLRREKLSITTEVIWNRDWFKSAVHACAREAADLIIKSSYSHKGRKHPLHERSDFYLIRNSTCPVLLTKKGDARPLTRVLAAVAIENGNKEHMGLNNRIVAQAKRACRSSGAELHLVAALSGTPNLLKLLDLQREDHELRSERDLIAQRFGLESVRVHVGRGAAAEVIVKTAKTLKAQQLVLGTRARKGLKGALLGNTAEKVLDSLELDVLVIN